MKEENKRGCGRNTEGEEEKSFGFSKKEIRGELEERRKSQEGRKQGTPFGESRRKKKGKSEKALGSASGSGSIVGSGSRR